MPKRYHQPARIASTSTEWRQVEANIRHDISIIAERSGDPEQGAALFRLLDVLVSDDLSELDRSVAAHYALRQSFLHCEESEAALKATQQALRPQHPRLRAVKTA